MSRDPDRLFPLDTAARDVARGLYESVRGLPILSPHGHVDPRWILEDAAFPDPVSLLVAPDHYVTRVLTSAGIDVQELLGGDPELAWGELVRHRHRFAGTATGYWLDDQLAELFDVDLGELDATESYRRIADAIAAPALRPRALLERFGVEVLATTDDPLDELTVHRGLAVDPSLRTRVLPTPRFDAYVDPSHPGFADAVSRVASSGSIEPEDLTGYLTELRRHRERFRALGATSVDVSVRTPFTTQLDPVDAGRRFRRVVAGQADADDLRLLGGHLLTELIGMSVDDGLTAMLHVGVWRNHSSAMLDRAGPDTGHDIPVATEFTGNLRPVLERFGLDPRLRLVVFALDEAAVARELAPLAGFYPSLFLGAPWWFLDAPDAMLRHRQAVTEVAGFYRGSGFVDDTRALTSIGVRHDTSRRIDAAALARLVVSGRMSVRMAERIAIDLVTTVPREVFGL